jgi:hypothetical protein
MGDDTGQEAALFKLLFDPRNRVLLTRLSGPYTQDDLVVRDRAVARFVARHGLMRGIMDFTAVDTIEVPIDRLVRRAHEPPLLPGQARVIVAPGDAAYEMNRVMIAHQLYVRKVEPLLVRSLDEAYRALAMDRPSFEEIEGNDADRLDDSMTSVLARIDEARIEGQEAAGSAERRLLREKLMRLLDQVPVTRARMPAPRGPSAITLSDVLNAALRRAALNDGDLAAHCETCHQHAPLSSLKLLAGRETRYACPHCHRVLITLAPAAKAESELPAHTYRIGDFDLSTETDIECPGARLPRSTRSPA